MTNLDDAIRDALTPDDPNALDPTDRGLQSAITRAFTRHMRALMVIAWIKMIFFIAGAAVAASIFATTDTPRTQIGAAAVSTILAVSTGQMFIIYWMQVTRSMTTRELKRLELQITRLAQHP